MLKVQKEVNKSSASDIFLWKCHTVVSIEIGINRCFYHNYTWFLQKRRSVLEKERSRRNSSMQFWSFKASNITETYRTLLEVGPVTYWSERE